MAKIRAFGYDPASAGVLLYWTDPTDIPRLQHECSGYLLQVHIVISSQIVYDASPASAKVQNVLAFKDIPHYRVEVAMVLPRPEISGQLGIGYRRIPILAIGNDVYCDTALIIATLERRFPQSLGYPTLFPERKDGGRPDTGMLKLLATFYADRSLFSLASRSLPYHKFKQDFIDDRSKWFGEPMDVVALTAKQPAIKSQLSSHMSFLEEHLSDGREWLFDTVSPSFADFSIYAIYGWIIWFRGMREVLTPIKFPKSHSWMARMAEIVKFIREANAPKIRMIQGDEAAKLISNSRGEQLYFDKDEAAMLSLQYKERVSIAPDDNATDYPTTGILVGLTREEFAIELSGSAVPTLRCHFPRFGYSVSVIGSKL